MAEETKQKNTPKGRVFSGVVVSNKMKDTVVVEISRYVKHAKYQKFLLKKKKFKAHDVGNTKQMGEKVSIRETKPISKDKHFVIVSSDASLKL